VCDSVCNDSFGTGMRTYLSRLSTPLLQEQFIQEYENKVRQRYPTGPIFFPFRRLFFAATRGSK
jgi:trans-aconitate methyltransferase